MTSDKKAEANRQNALKSTGPKTPEGKAAVRLNALKHGLLSQEILLPGEDEEALRELGERLRDELQPVGELENLLVDRIIASYWRLRRLGRVEAGIFAWERSEELAERAEREAQRYESSQVDGPCKGSRYHHNRRKEARGGPLQGPPNKERAGGRDRHTRADLRPGRRPGQRVLEALQVRDRHRAGSLPGVARAGAPASRPTRRCRHASPGCWTSRSRGCPKRRGTEIWLCLII